MFGDKGPFHKARYFTWHGATMRGPGLGPSSIPMGFRGHSASKRMKHLLQRPGSPVITWRIIPISKWLGSPPFISHLSYL